MFFITIIIRKQIHYFSCRYEVVLRKNTLSVYLSSFMSMSACESGLPSLPALALEMQITLCMVNRHSLVPIKSEQIGKDSRTAICKWEIEACSIAVVLNLPNRPHTVFLMLC